MIMLGVKYVLRNNGKMELKKGQVAVFKKKQITGSCWQKEAWRKQKEGRKK